MLAEGDLPALFRAADGASNAAQSRYLTLTKIRSAGLVLAAVAGVLSISWQSIDLAGVLAVASFGTALIVSSLVETEDLEGEWYEARAVAESTKTMAWEYSVGGRSVPIAMPESVADESFVDGLSCLLSGLVHADALATRDGSAITPKMRELRSSNLAVRRSEYLRGRVDAQRAWYADKARVNRERGRTWFLRLVALESGGILLGFFKAAGWIQFDGLGVLVALASAVAAWSQVKQFDSLAAAYGLTANELALVAERAPKTDDESEWAGYVSSAEEAISREHTMWKASRGLSHRRV